MADIFLSYSREDQARAEQIAKALTAAGYEVFWDVEIPPGKSWADVLEEKLGICKAAIVLWSRISTASKWVREEARLAHDRGKLIPVQIDDAPPPFGFGEIQAADLKHWHGDTSDPHWRSLLNAVAGAVARPPVSSPPTTSAARTATLGAMGVPLRAISAPIASIGSWLSPATRGYVLAGIGLLALLGAITLRYMPSSSTDRGSTEETGASPVTDSDGAGGNSGASGSTTSDEGGTSRTAPAPAPPPPAPPSPPQPTALSAGVTRAQMIGYLNARGYSAKLLEDSSVQTSVDGIIFDLYFFNCQGERCAELELSAGWKMQSLPSPDLLNQWNSTKRLAHAFTNDKGDGLLLQMDLSLANAASMGEFDAYLKIWKTLLGDFKKQFQL